MAQLGKGKLNYRCPSCFFRDLDIDMFYDKDTKEYHCIRCQYVAKEEEILNMNEAIRTRYRYINQRITEFEDFSF